jgi:hypothetical protein
MKVPQSWVADVAMAVQLVDIGLKFMRNTDSIVSIKFYVSLLETRNNMVMHRHAYKEITNKASLFHDGRDWDLFKEKSVPTSWNGMPSKWQRIFFPEYCIIREVSRYRDRLMNEAPMIDFAEAYLPSGYNLPPDVDGFLARLPDPENAWPLWGRRANGQMVYVSVPRKKKYQRNDARKPHPAQDLA